VRPEDVELSEVPSSGPSNTWTAVVDQKIFLGESIDFRVKVGERVLLARAHPRLATRIGAPIHVAIDAGKVHALKADDV
jgi:iron(III) transport system ATP-binding protein